MLKLTKWAIISALCVTADLHAVEFITQAPKGFMDFKLKDGLRVQTHYHIQQKDKIGASKYKKITNNTIRKGTISYWVYQPPKGPSVHWYARSNQLPESIEPIKWHHPFAKYDANAAKIYAGRTTSDGVNRFYDSEVKSIHHLYNLQQNGRVQAGGTLKGYVDKAACDSCRGVLTAAEENGLASKIQVFEAPEAYTNKFKQLRAKLGKLAEEGTNPLTCDL
ncbi:hypothetical protein [Zooshikella sp. RANM57]|uniref:hypothetical protein n=1 Tax=Zooshikella sp. RANM57 TaxID=3425863 RepID=UPI003D70059A